MATSKKGAAPKQEKTLTITAYGRLKGVSHTAINNAIRDGRIVKGYFVQKNGKKAIIPSIADKEWVENTNLDHHNSRYSANGGSHGSDKDEEKTNSGGNATLNAAKRAKAVFDAKLAELDYKKKAGELVEKQKVYANLFKYGQELRNNLLAVPDRIVDDMLAAPSRNEALTLLYDELARELEKSTDFSNKEIGSSR